VFLENCKKGAEKEGGTALLNYFLPLPSQPPQREKGKLRLMGLEKGRRKGEGEKRCLSNF